nr:MULTISPECIES: hypothetical protein [Mycobacterium ulcerans group]
MSRRDDVQGRPAVDTRIPESMAARLQRAQSWAIGSDPGLLRLRMATRTTAALGCSLLVLYLLTMATGQPLTVALIGVVITMIAARSVDDPDSRQQQITMALLPVPAALSISVAALLAPHLIAAEVAFVVIVFAAVYVRRFGPRGRALGMVAFMAYFFSLYLLLQPVSAGRGGPVALDDRRRAGGHPVHVCDEHLCAARPPRKCAARHDSLAASADGDRGGHRRRHRASGSAR